MPQSDTLIVDQTAISASRDLTYPTLRAGEHMGFEDQLILSALSREPSRLHPRMGALVSAKITAAKGHEQSFAMPPRSTRDCPDSGR